MYNWSVDESELRKNPAQHTIWRLEQLINYGLNGEKISLNDLQRHWDELTLDPHRRRFLQLLLNG